jgi:hypothetical protein
MNGLKKLIPNVGGETWYKSLFGKLRYGWTITIS